MKTENLRIMLISQLHPDVGGIQTWAKVFMAYCNKKKISLRCVDSSLIGKRGIDSNDKINLHDEIKRCFLIWKSIKKELDNFSPNVIHFNSACSPRGLIRDLISITIINKYKTKIVFQCHCNIEDQIKGNRIGFLCLKKIVNKVSKILVLNEQSKEYVSSKFNKDSLIIPNFVDKSIIINKKKISDSIRVALYVGHIRKEKGINIILDVAKKFPDIKFKLIGPIIEKDLMINKDNVKFIGSLEHEKVLQEMENADVFVFPSYTEGFSLSILEAMAKGLPIIATDAGANKEILQEYTIKATSKDISDRLIRYNNKQTREKISKDLVRRVKCNYTSDIVIDKIMKVY